MVVLDTTFLIHFLKNKQNALAKAKSLGVEVSTTRLNIFEFLIGVYYEKDVETEKMFGIFNDFLDSIRILELDATSADTAAKISVDLRRKGLTVKDNDILIAAIALTNGEETIITQNTKDFSKIKGIKADGY